MPTSLRQLVTAKVNVNDSVSVAVGLDDARLAGGGGVKHFASKLKKCLEGTNRKVNIAGM